MELTQFLTRLPKYQRIVSQLKPATKQLVTGMSGSARTLFLDAIFGRVKRPLLIVTDTLQHMSTIADDLANLIPADQLFEFPVEELLAAEVATSSPHYRSQRVQALHALQSQKPVVVVTSVSGIRRMLPTPQTFNAAQLVVKKGDNFKLKDLRLQLHRMGYKFRNLVAAPGDFSIRGSIVDVYPLNANYPVRLDFFDTEVDSLRTFDVANQSSIGHIESARILPATDFVVTADQRQAGAKKINEALHQSYRRIKSNKLKRTLTSNVRPIVTSLKKGLADNHWLMYADYLYSRHTSLMDYLPRNGIVAFCDYSRLRRSNRQIVSDEQHWVEGQLESAKVIAHSTFSLAFETECQKGSQSQLYFSLFAKSLPKIKLNQITDLQARSVQNFWGQIPLLHTELKAWRDDHQTIVIMADGEKQVKRVSQALAASRIKVVSTDWDHVVENRVQIIPENLSAGFQFKDANLVIISESEIFKKAHYRHHRQRQTFANAQRIKSYTDLKPGDYVVHVNHGIGRYLGMKTIKVDGKHQDYLSIAYRDNAKLFIPVTQLNLIQKYVSSEDRHPHVNKLGGKSWARTKRRVAHRIEGIADDLIDLYAKRSSERGYAYPPDDSEQRKFEANFPYQLTPDQARSTREIKADMEKPHPMDRLLVGDVGYGKTEVALRAAFKAIEANKQVAMLVPTTVLAHQHYETVTNRFKGFPVSIGVLSRFRTPKQIRQTLRDLKAGKIDFVIGTHRLLSKDVHFHDLGLLIVDEEQRFGVKHKNKIKKMKSSIDVLMLTATPIPRTLNMSMIGVRDLSIIETPPTNRYPIQTYVMEENAGTIQSGIRREMERGGQVFFLHNRVKDIEHQAHALKQLVPKARIAYVDGQMNEQTMEQVMYDFVHKRYDVLVATTIIGNGLDITNANTLFVEDADHMGLSQLYQLRGRVGRGSRIAYAYFMYRPNKVLTEVGEKRLEAMRDFTELGSGFKIAMRDLSIRGAGNLLGKQQHGFINSVGYDLYTQMLSDAVSRKQGKETHSRINSIVTLGVEAYLPTAYIGDSQQKIEMYKRLRQMRSNDDFKSIEHDLVDRFGSYPEAVKSLLLISRIKMLADFALVARIHRAGRKLTVVISQSGTNLYSSSDFLRAIAKTKFKASINEKSGQMVIGLEIQLPDVAHHAWLKDLLKLVNSLEKRRLKLVNAHHSQSVKPKVRK